MSNRNNCIILFVCVFFINLLTLSLILNSTSAYYGEGDCMDEHGIEHIGVARDPDALLTLDGNPSEPFWTKPSNQVGFKTIKLAEERTGLTIPEIYELNITFVMNDQYLYILCQWNDNTPLYEAPPEKDGLAFCWNINTPNFSAYYVNDMNTVHMGGGRVDGWRWTYLSSKDPGEPHLSGDDCFDQNGWIDGNPEAKSIEVAYTNTASSYILEMRRLIDTNEIYDVQFTEKKFYEFNIGILNDTLYEGHAISWTYALDLRQSQNNGINGFPLLILFFSGLIGVPLSILSIKKKIK